MNSILRFTFLVCASVAFTGCCQYRNYLQREDRIVYSTIHDAVDDIQEKHAFKVKGAALTVSHAAPIYDFDFAKIIKMRASLEINRILTKDEAREMVVDASNSLLDNINYNKDLRLYLSHYPFTINDLTIEIFNKGNFPEETYVAHVKLEQGLITYRSKDPENDGLSNVYEYSEDALQIVSLPKEKPQPKESYPKITIPELCLRRI